MNTRRLEDGARFLGSTSWAAIASGVFLALALQSLLLLLGVAFASSVGDRVPENGYSVWAVLVQLLSFAVGGAVAASLARATSASYGDPAPRGVALGVMVWAVALVVGGALTVLVTRGSFATNAWLTFFGALLALAAAIGGAVFGARLGRAVGPGASMTPGDVAHAGELR